MIEELKMARVYNTLLLLAQLVHQIKTKQLIAKFSAQPISLSHPSRMYAYKRHAILIKHLLSKPYLKEPIILLKSRWVGSIKTEFWKNICYWIKVEGEYF